MPTPSWGEKSASYMGRKADSEECEAAIRFGYPQMFAMAKFFVSSTD